MVITLFRFIRYRVKVQGKSIKLINNVEETRKQTNFTRSDSCHVHVYYTLHFFYTLTVKIQNIVALATFLSGPTNRAEFPLQ